MKTQNSHLKVIQFCFSKFFAVIKSDKSLLFSFCLAIGVFFIALLFNVMLPLVLKYIIQALENISSSTQLLIVVVGGYGVMWTVAQIGEHIREMLSVSAVERTLSKFISSFYGTILNSDGSQKILPSTGSIINKLSIFREGFHNLIWGILFFLLPTIIEILCACMVLWYLYGGFYSVILLLTVGLYSICSYFGVSFYLKYQIEAYDRSAKVSGFLSDRLFNIETVNSLGNPDIELSALDIQLKDFEDQTIKAKQAFETVRIIQGIIIGGALTLMICHCIQNITEGKQGVSDFVLINSYVLQFFTPLSSLGVILNDIYRSFAEVTGMINLTKSVSAEVRLSGKLRPSLASSSLVVKNMSFSYSKKNQSFLLKGINLDLKAGWKIGIIGSSGSGKTTLGKLLSGLYSPEEGELHFNGIPFSAYERQVLKELVSYAPQQVQIFNDTLRCNLLYANPEASLKDLEEAIKQAQLGAVIKHLPDGLNTVLGEQGYSLSGGERQRIGIARAILKKPSIYVLDEPTSFLDLQTEAKILSYFRAQEGITTQIIIAHQLHLIMDADWIVMLERGKIIAQGPPKELLENNPTFKELLKLDNHEYNPESLPIDKLTKIQKKS